MPLPIQPDPPCLSYGSVCSDIEAVTVAWQPLRLHPASFAEIDLFPSAVLRGAVKASDPLVGGTPCQSFSVAGMRGGLNDPRGALSLKYVELADAVDLVRTRRGQPPAVLVWENVSAARQLRQQQLSTGLPVELVEVLHLAAQADVRILIFDPDAAQLDGLHTYLP